MNLIWKNLAGPPDAGGHTDAPAGCPVTIEEVRESGAYVIISYAVVPAVPAGPRIRPETQRALRLLAETDDAVLEAAILLGLTREQRARLFRFLTEDRKP